MRIIQTVPKPLQDVETSRSGASDGVTRRHSAVSCWRTRVEWLYWEHVECLRPRSNDKMRSLRVVIWHWVFLQVQSYEDRAVWLRFEMLRVMSGVMRAIHIVDREKAKSRLYMRFERLGCYAFIRKYWKILRRQNWIFFLVFILMIYISQISHSYNFNKICL